jgi:hypothetical protein
MRESDSCYLGYIVMLRDEAGAGRVLFLRNSKARMDKRAFDFHAMKTCLRVRRLPSKENPALGGVFF